MIIYQPSPNFFFVFDMIEACSIWRLLADEHFIAELVNLGKLALASTSSLKQALDYHIYKYINMVPGFRYALPGETGM